MRKTGWGSVAGTSALLLCLLASASPAQEKTRQRAPVLRIYSQNGPDVSSNYVTPAIKLGEDAYVFAVMMDLDGHIQVLHPDFPGISVRVRAQKQLYLPNFFAGFNEPASQYGMAGYGGSTGIDEDARGTIIALASRAPFNLSLIEADGDWDMSAIRRLIERRTPEFAAQALTRYLGAKGEPIGYDYMRFAGGRQNYYTYNGYNSYGGYGYCGHDNYSYAARRSAYGVQIFHAAQLRSLGLRPFVAGYDECGLPIVVVAPFSPTGRLPFRPPVRHPGDTTIFPKSHFPQGFAHRPSTGGGTAVGAFPTRGALPQLRDATITAPRGRRAEPREILDQFRPQPGVTAVPEGVRMPVERTLPSHGGSVESGFRPVYRPDPLVAAPSQPTRAPERVREPAPAPVIHERPPAPSPAPVVYERPSSPPPRESAPPPPPRAEPSRPRLEPAPTPPPRQ
jgi:hypothetical protein